MNILITAIGSFAADIVIKTLHENNHHVVGCDIFPKAWIADAYNVDEFVQAPHSRDRAAYISFIKDACQRFAVQYIMPLTDPEVDIISEIKDELRGIGVCACAADYEVVRLCRDKYLLPQYLAREAIGNIIPTYLLDGSVGYSNEYPMLAKPRFGRSSVGIIEVKTDAEYGYVKEKAKYCDYIIQPFIKGNILTVDVVRNTDNRVVCAARRELLRNPSGAGTTVEIITDDKLTATCTEIANSLGIIGAMNFEFIEAQDKLYFLEANPRLSGGVEFSHIAGYDVVTNHLRCFTNQLIDREIEIKKMIIARKYEEYITAVL